MEAIRVRLLTPLHRVEAEPPLPVDEAGENARIVQESAKTGDLMVCLMMREVLLEWCGFDGPRLMSLTGNEIQRKAPACWAATLLCGGVLRVTTWRAP